MSQTLFKSESHVFEVDRKNILFDVLRGGFFEIDGVTRDVLALCEGQTPEEVVRALSESYRSETVRGVLEELEQAEVVAREPFKVAPFHPPSCIEVSHLSLCVTRDNAERGAQNAERGSKTHGSSFIVHRSSFPPQPDRQLYMSEAVALCAVDFLLRASGVLRDCEVTFEGGEPLLNVPLIRRIVAYGEERAEELGKRIAFEVVTDGALLTPRIADYFAEKGVALVLEFGPDSDSRAVERAASILRSEHPVETLHLRVVASGRCLDLAERIEALGDLFPFAASVGVRWASLPSGHPDALRTEDLERVRSALRELSAHTLRRLLVREETVLEEIEGPMAQLQERHVLFYSCGAGTRSLAVSPEGALFPCFDLIGWELLRVGDVFSGIDAERYRDWLRDLHVERRQSCKTCWARYLCGGGCRADAVLTTGDPAVPNPVSCERIRHAYELGMALCLEVEEREPGLLASRYLENADAPTEFEVFDERPVLERYA